MMRHYFLFLWLLFPVLVSAQDLSLYQKKEFTYGSNILPYRILYPENYNPSKKYPLVLFLHGAGERGSDNEKQLTHGAKIFLDAANRKNFPAIVLFPQCPETEFWPAVKIDNSKQPIQILFDYTMPANWPLVAANSLVQHMIADGVADAKRVYITGLSMGGMGTFESVYRYPKLYAAAMPICGGGDTALYDARVKKVPFWVFHGSVDEIVDVKLSQQMVQKLQQFKVRVRYSEYPGVNHNSWDNAFAEPDFIKWMFQQKRKK
jgi:predicted peptidase